ncbi:copper chaperone PCu(A)C [Rhodanobacter sp. KK11]|uniref:copper chaperone PCu(A)C n=1 Tax=Rhodanobacter sp. KK11 TaxID=3083255 RepID=UPI002965E2C3|nr:copper chaperone PCu(A)C [Rhodanobacter sp. KK11]MDW2982124.1 copper chaperone PCu(A)C [Rhodanobacter sp. KK11]
MKPIALSLLLSGLLLAGGAHAADADQVRASHAWIRLLPGALPAGAYVTLENDGDRPVALRGAASTVYAEVMLHRSSREGGMSRMSMVDALEVPAHGKAELAPAGYHLMLTQPKVPVKPGDTVTLTLRFGDGSTLATDFIARPANALDAGDEHADHAMPAMDHGAMPHGH